MTNQPACELPASHRLREVAIVFTKLGFTAFGGPMAHLALMEDELVRRRKWCDRQTFLDLAAAVNFIPGPNSTELAIHLGYLRAGRLGLIVAGVCFITPAVLIILPIAYLYVKYQKLPQMQPILHTVSAVIIAIIATATIRLARTTLTGPLAWLLAGLTLLLAAMGNAGVWPVTNLFATVQMEIILLALSALIGIIATIRPQRLVMLGIPVTGDMLPKLIDNHWAHNEWTHMVVFFFKTGATLFGSGYVLASFLQTGLVEQYGWLTPRELSDAIAVGQFTPGPLLTTATFIGYLLGHNRFHSGDVGGVVNGVVGAVLATVAIFLPSFLLIAILAPVLQKMRQSRIARAALDAMNAAVVALIAVTLLRLSAVAFYMPDTAAADGFNVCVAGASIALMLWRGINATWLVGGAVLIGLIRVKMHV
jgi:chromate transporter